MVDRSGRTELHYAAFENQPERVTELLAAGEDIELADKNGYTPLHCAAQNQALEAAQVLLANGASVDPVDGWGNTPLWRATFNCDGNGDVIRLLREHGADPMRENASGNSPLAMARGIANYPIAQFFDDLP